MLLQHLRQSPYYIMHRNAKFKKNYAVIVGIHSIKGLVRKEESLTKKGFILFSIVFAFSFAITLGTLREVFEFAGDYLFKSNMVKGGLKDTITDLIVKILSAFITSIIFYRKLK